MELYYVVTLVDGQRVLRKTKRIRGAISAELATEYMRVNAAGVYQLWLEAMRTKRVLRTLRWWSWGNGGVIFMGNADENARETYVATLGRFLRENKEDGIVRELLLRSMNAREKRALNALMAR